MIELERRRLEEAGQLGRELISGLPGATLLILDSQLVIRTVEGAARRRLECFGPLGRLVSDVIPAPAWRRLEPRYTAALAGETQVFDYDAIEEPTRHSVRLVPICDRSEALGVMMISHDITSRAAPSEVAHEDSRLRRTVLEALDEGVVVLGMDGRLLDANPAACGMLGFDLASARADPEWWSAFTVRQLPDRTPLAVGGDVLASGVGVHDVEIELTHPDGTPMWLTANYLPLRDDDDAVSGLVLAFRDVSEKELARKEAARSRDFLQATLDSLSDHISVLDANGEIVMHNAAWTRFSAMNGSSPDRLGGNYLTACDRAGEDDEDLRRIAAALRAILAGEATEVNLEYLLRRPGGDRWFVMNATRFSGMGDARVVVSHHDITKRRHAEIAASTQAALLDEVDMAVIATDFEGHVTHWNRGAEEMYGWSRDEALRLPASELIVPVEDASLTESPSRLGQDGRWEGELRLKRRDGSTFPSYIRNRLLPAGNGRPPRIVALSIDISDRIAAKRELVEARNYLRAVTDSVGEGLFTIDNDGNVAYMNASAERLFGYSFSEARGRSMHYLVHGHNPDGSALAAEDCRIQQACVSGQTIHSEDEVFAHRDGRLLEVAYTAAPFATDEGIQGCVVVLEDISERRSREREVQHDLDVLAGIERVQQALQEKRFALHAQPIIELSTGRVVQRELLLRVHERDGQVVGPAGYLPLAERVGLIGDIDRWVIRQACEITATSGLPVELNLSAHSVGDPAILGHIEQCISGAGADPRLMVFEITETALMENQQAAHTFANHLHQLGCRLALDDFGTGYGSFTYLKQLSVDFLKIDMEFVRDLTLNAASRHVVEAVVAIAASFDLKTVGEGVEDAETLELLRELGVDFAQGFHIGRPRPLEQSQNSAAAARLRRAQTRPSERSGRAIASGPRVG